MRKLWAVPLVVAALAAGAWFARDVIPPASTPAPSAAPAKAATATLARQDLTSSVSLTGQLGHGTARPVKGGKAGVVTWLPTPGTVVSRGKPLYRINDQPVPLFYGAMPLFRPLAQPNLVGRDVRVVRENLKALGYAVGRRFSQGDRVRQPAAQPSAPPVQVEVRAGEDVFTPALVAAVKRWQDDVGLPVTGTIGPGDVAVLTGAVRVESLAALTGDAAEAPLMAVTAVAKVVTVQAEPSEAGTIRRGDQVTVRLPDDRTVPGRVGGVATTVRAGEDGSPPTVTVSIRLDKPAAVARLDAAAVQVEFPAETRPGVLVAPVGALLALAEGGYAVQLEGGGLVAVETGMFAGGLVEISGAGLTPGTRVVTTS
ncbi:peptidoglycan-binding protein [Paractinoplanes abujensis]|uniref:Peptidoglycan hydrolase-like protein with peptidoglycan-binding domain n=1 Tax=Paractinoplanes abujensis TaxID=882441 RepID=A0A7W7CQ35_9ACTN|nr:peptidoglycan-binding protein [Actinoplanes abujensis]MBB4692641.1 peptidoglycan hydrolase-like protein with peptidoglycan-binding domain [Actinoplanes abujensis]GID22858.1 peptidoglycan-binding protein [Actinoplanes abujensis]